MKKVIIFSMAVFFICAAGLRAGEEEEEAAMQMSITSPEFKNNSFIPGKFTCQGEDVNPALIITGIPDKARSLVLIVDDPDAPMGTWVHWVVYDVPITDKIAENSVPGTQGINDFRVKSYKGPCPPSGTHRYFFRIYALDKKLGVEEGITRGDLEEAMEGHILNSAELIGLYKK